MATAATRQSQRCFSVVVDKLHKKLLHPYNSPHRSSLVRSLSTTTASNSANTKDISQKRIRFWKRPQLHVMENDFAAFVREAQARRYKVHKPACDCTKLQKLRKHRVAPHNALDKLATGFGIVPDSPVVKWVFFAQPNLTRDEYEADPLFHEMQLYQNTLVPLLHSEDLPSIKLRVAQCLLQDKHPNGFLVVASQQHAQVNQARDWSRQQTAALKATSSLHKDNADYVCTLSVSTLRQVMISKRPHYKAVDIDDDCPKKGTSPSEARDALRTALKMQNVPADMDKSIKLGHHIQSALTILQNENDEESSPLYILTLVYVYSMKGKNLLIIDVPGGKRNLGESSWDCVLRETKEEISLDIGKDWLYPAGTNKNNPRRGLGFNACNTFYLARPNSRRRHRRRKCG